MSRKQILLKIVITGDANVGKTSVMSRFMRDLFQQKYNPTIGADFLTKEIQVDGRMITLQIWDTAGQEKFQSLGVAFYKGADAFIVVYDINVKKTFNSIEKHINNLNEHYDGKIHPFPLLIFGNKMDIQDDQMKIPTETVSQWIKKTKREQNTLFYEISCKDYEYKHIIDSGFIELCRMCIDNQTDSLLQQAFLQENNTYVRMPRETDPTKKKLNVTKRTCTAGSSRCLTQNPSSDAFCQIL
eukprot:210778_1